MTSTLKNHWPVILIVAAALLARSYKLEELFYFTYDESVFAFIGRRFWLWQHIPLIGGVSPFGVHVAPYFYWFFGFTLGFGNLNPLIWGYISAILGTATTLLVFITGKEIASKKVGLMAAVFWAFSFLASLYDRHFWGLTFGPSFSLAVIYCLLKIKKGREYFIYLLGILLALIIHADLSYYMLLIFAAVYWIVFKLPIKKSTFISVGIILFSFLPLIVFDIRHNFANTRPFFEFWQKRETNFGFDVSNLVENTLLFPRAFSRLIYVFGDNEIAKQYSYCDTYVKGKLIAVPPYFVLFTSLVLISFLVWSYRLRKTSTGWYLISLLIVIYFLGIQAYGTIFKADIFEHYITGLFGVFLIILAYFAAKLPKKIWLIILAGFIIVNLQKLFSAKNSMGLTYKRQAIEHAVQKVENKDFSLDSLSSCWRYGGYRYLFAVFGREPVKSYVDPNLAHLYGPTKVASEHPETVVVFVTHDFAPETDTFYKQYARLKAHEVENRIFGNIELIILDNSKKWFF